MSRGWFVEFTVKQFVWMLYTITRMVHVWQPASSGADVRLWTYSADTMPSSTGSQFRFEFRSEVSIIPVTVYGKRYETMVNKWWDRSDWWIVRLTKASIQRNKKWSHHWIVLCCYRREMGQGYRGLYLSPINVTNYTAYNINKLWRNEFVNWIVVTVASNHLQGPRWGRGKWLEVTVVGSTFSGLHGRLLN